MAVSRQTMAAGQQPVGKTSESTSVADLVGVILDKGIVIDAWTRVSVVGLEVLTIEARVVVASVETYLRYADAIARTAVAAAPPKQQTASAWENEHHRVLEGEVLHPPSQHPEGLPAEAVQALLDAPREQLREILDHLPEEQKVRRDEEHDSTPPQGR